MTVQVSSLSTVDSAARLLSSDKTARMLGGGTLLMQRVNAGDPGIRKLVRVDDPALTDISAGGANISIGAGVTMSQLLMKPELEFLHSAARCVGGPAIRNMATLGGNLFARAPYGDLAVLLVALGAEVSLAGQSGSRPVAIERLFERSGSAPPLVRAVNIRRPQGQVMFHKMSRMNPRGPAIVTLAIHLDQSAGRIREARVALGGVADRPCLSMGAARAMGNSRLDDATIERAVTDAMRGIEPRTDAIASGWYREQMVQVHLRRALTQMAGG